MGCSRSLSGRPGWTPSLGSTTFFPSSSGRGENLKLVVAPSGDGGWVLVPLVTTTSISRFFFSPAVADEERGGGRSTPQERDGCFTAKVSCLKEKLPSLDNPVPSWCRHGLLSRANLFRMHMSSKKVSHLPHISLWVEKHASSKCIGDDTNPPPFKATLSTPRPHSRRTPDQVSTAHASRAPLGIPGPHCTRPSGFPDQDMLFVLFYFSEWRGASVIDGGRCSSLPSPLVLCGV